MTQKQANDMFLSYILKLEGGRSQSKIGDGRQLLDLMNRTLGRALYPLIKIWAEFQSLKNKQ